MLFMLFGGMVFSQPLEGHLYFAGSFGYMSDSYQQEQDGNILVENDISSFSFRPAVGFTVQDNLLVGARLHLVAQSVNDNDDTDFGLELFGRYYIPANEENRFFFFPELRLGFANDELYNRRAPGSWPEEPTQFIAGISPGFAFYPTTHWGIEMNVGFLGFTTASAVDEDPNPDVDVSHSSFDFTLDGTAVNVGISYLLMLGE